MGSMMKRILTALGAVMLMTEVANAACGITNAQMKDNAAVTFNAPYADDGAGASNCSPQIQIKQGGNVVSVTNNNADAVATAAANMNVISFAYGFNGTTWDRLQVDGSKNLKVSVTTALPAGSNQIGTINPATALSWNTTWAGGTLGAMANYGTSPGAVLVPGANVFVTNANANGVTTSSGSSPVVNALDLVNSTTGNIVANNTTSVVVNAAATTVYSIQLGGIGSAPAYLKLYNATSATCGSGTPVKRLIIPAAATAANGAGSNIVFPLGLRFGTGLTYCVTTGIGDADTTAPAASTFLVNIDWH